MASLVLAEHNNASLDEATAKAVSAAARISTPVHVLVAGADCRSAAEQAAKISGVEKVLLADQPVRVKPKDKLLVEIRLDGSRHLRFKDRYLNFKSIAKPPYRPFYAGKKEVVSAVGLPRFNKPAKNHPWRKSYMGILRAPSAPAPCL